MTDETNPPAEDPAADAVEAAERVLNPDAAPAAEPSPGDLGDESGTPKEETPPPPPPVPTRESDEDFVVRKIQSWKYMAGYWYANRLGVTITPQVEPVLYLNKDTVGALRANAAWLAPKLRRTAGDGKAELLICCFMEALSTRMALQRIAYLQHGSRNPRREKPAGKPEPSPADPDEEAVEEEEVEEDDDDVPPAPLTKTPRPGPELEPHDDGCDD